MKLLVQIKFILIYQLNKYHPTKYLEPLKTDKYVPKIFKNAFPTESIIAKTNICSINANYATKWNSWTYRYYSL